MLDYRIHTFLALYNEMNYRRTAEKLNMTQPGVTQHIHFLESYYGVKLFEYDGRTLSRTKNAEVLKRYFDSVRTEEIVIRDSFTDNSNVTLSIGATKTIGEFIIVPQIKHFLSFEDHSLELVVDNTETLLAMLEKAELDFAIVEGVFDKCRYGHHLYKQEDFVGICSADHPFANRVVSLSELFDEGIVVREKGSGTRRLLEQAMHDRGYSFDCFKRCFTVNNFSIICELVADQYAVTFAYAPIAHSRDDLATFQINDISIKGEFNFVYCNERTAKEKIEIFLK